jgi:hypothetical protein
MSARSALRLGCDCGSVAGIVSGATPRTARRLVCYCDDCQRFAAALGVADSVLDEHGGTEVLHISPARVTFTHGHTEIECLRLSTRGIFRWYSACCNTPIGNTLPTSRLPFLSLIHTCLHVENGTLGDVVGPVQSRLQGRFAIRGMPPDTHPAVPVAAVVLAAGKSLGWWLRGDQRRSPFFDRSGKPIVEPHIAPRAQA